MSDNSKIKVFFSYSHLDEKHRGDLDTHLASLKRNGLIDIWYDRKINAGNEVNQEILENLSDSDIVVLLVSAYFIASDYCYETEMTTALKLYKEGKLIVIPVILSKCSWRDTPLNDLKAIPKDGYPILDWSSIDHAYSDIYDEIKKVAEGIRKKKEELIQKGQDDKTVFNPLANNSINKLSDAPKPRQYFTGREKEIAAFKEAINAGYTFVAIDGAGGIGKTQFISRCIEKYIPQEKVIWYQCTQASHLDTLISEAGYPELLKGSNKADKEKFSAFKDKIQENGYFLFLDNFQETNNNPVFKEFLLFIQEYLKKGCVIVIDRDDIRSAYLTPYSIHIEGFKEKKLEYAKALIAHTFRENVTIDDSELEKLCEQLQGYPLAIDFAIYLLSQGETPVNIITKIVSEGEEEEISERLLNAIFSRSDASQEEKDFITQFSVFTGMVAEGVVKSVIHDSLHGATKKLQKKNLLLYHSGYYEIHPLVREFCYKKLEDKVLVHAKIAEHYINERNNQLSPTLEEQIFYHLSKSNQWDRIEKEIEEKGRQFILLGQIGLLKDLLNKLKEIGIDKPIFNIFYGDIFAIQGKWKEAEKYFDTARSNRDDKKVKAEGIIKYGEIFHGRGNMTEALSLYEESYDFSNTYKLLKEKSRALNNIGLVYDIYGQLDKANEKFNESLRIRIEVDDKEGIAESLRNIAVISQTKGEIDTALKKVEESLEIEKQIGNKSGIASSLCSIGKLFNLKGDMNAALKKYEESLEIQHVIGDKIGISDSITFIAHVFRKRNKLDKALNLYEECLQISNEIGWKQGISASLNHIGLILDEKKQYEEAILKYKESLKIAIEIGNKGVFLQYFIILGLYCFPKENSKKQLMNLIRH